MCAPDARGGGGGFPLREEEEEGATCANYAWGAQGYIETTREFEDLLRRLLRYLSRARLAGYRIIWSAKRGAQGSRYNELADSHNRGGGRGN